jgi:hypothetical protein
MKPIIVGLSNPYSNDPANALVPWPDGCAGYRLWKMASNIGSRFLGQQDYIQAFDRRNLCPAAIQRRLQRRYGKYLAKKLKDTFPPGATVFLLGREVLDAFNSCVDESLQPILIHPQVADGITWRWLPHPSGRVTQYNDPVLRTLVGMALADALENSHASQ